MATAYGMEVTARFGAMVADDQGEDLAGVADGVDHVIVFLMNIPTEDINQPIVFPNLF